MGEWVLTLINPPACSELHGVANELGVSWAEGFVTNFYERLGGDKGREVPL
jgi:hypothetical protein